MRIVIAVWLATAALGRMMETCRATDVLLYAGLSGMDPESPMYRHVDGACWDAIVKVVEEHKMKVISWPFINVMELPEGKQGIGTVEDVTLNAPDTPFVPSMFALFIKAHTLSVLGPQANLNNALASLPPSPIGLSLETISFVSIAGLKLPQTLMDTFPRLGAIVFEKMDVSSVFAGPIPIQHLVFSEVRGVPSRFPLPDVQFVTFVHQSVEAALMSNFPQAWRLVLYNATVASGNIPFDSVRRLDLSNVDKVVFSKAMMRRFPVLKQMFIQAVRNVVSESFKMTSFDFIHFEDSKLKDVSTLARLTAASRSVVLDNVDLGSTKVNSKTLRAHEVSELTVAGHMKDKLSVFFAIYPNLKRLGLSSAEGHLPSVRNLPKTLNALVLQNTTSEDMKDLLLRMQHQITDLYLRDTDMAVLGDAALPHVTQLTMEGLERPMQVDVDQWKRYVPTLKQINIRGRVSSILPAQPQNKIKTLKLIHIQDHPESQGVNLAALNSATAIAHLSVGGTEEENEDRIVVDSAGFQGVLFLGFDYVREVALQDVMDDAVTLLLINVGTLSGMPVTEAFPRMSKLGVVNPSILGVGLEFLGVKDLQVFSQEPFTIRGISFPNVVTFTTHGQLTDLENEMPSVKAWAMLQPIKVPGALPLNKMPSLTELTAFTTTIFSIQKGSSAITTINLLNQPLQRLDPVLEVFPCARLVFRGKVLLAGTCPQ